ncbi:MAG: DUF4860 domain-containing protein [Oscillospiraceae bacterium]|nr:DUF4860 domain-containing protein [Oscillospiraceae bacterium]
MKKQTDHLEGLLALLLFGVFAVCLLIVLLTGANSYQSLTQRDRAAADRRTCTQYLATRVRQSDAQGGVGSGRFGDGEALAITEQIGDQEYVTWVYAHEGWLMELFCAADADLSPSDGERIMALHGLSVREEDGLLTLAVTLEEGDEPIELRLSLRSGEGAGS